MELSNEQLKNASARQSRQDKGFFVVNKAILVVLITCLGIIGLVAVGYNFISTLQHQYATYTNHRSTDQRLSNKASESGHLNKKSGVRLPDSIVPMYYKLELIPFLEPEKNFTFHGKVWIDVNCVIDTPHIILHVRDLMIHTENVTVIKVEEAELPVSLNNPHNVKVESHEFDKEMEFYKIIVGGAKLQAGKLYRIFIQYTGVLDNGLWGFYRSSYFNTEVNETRYIAATQFEATNARRAFPCFDEPALKAKFEVSIARQENMSSISNMDLVISEPIQEMNGWVWDHYRKSVPMSTYLLAVVVSDFGYRISNRSYSKSQFRVWARHSAIPQAEFAGNIGARILTFYENYFEVDYPLPKQDLVAIPDFHASAMENWGLVIFRESSMLFDEIRASDEFKQLIALTISHELAHQWFGNLVTPKWWNDLWLNEGFSRYIEYLAVDHVYPDWNAKELFVIDALHNAMKLDMLDSSHPISSPVHHPDEISTLFDHISYAKGASIIRMINHVLTESSFKKGLHNYLTKWSYMAVDQYDLWNSLTQQAHFDETLDPAITVAQVMDCWTLQKGYPVVTVHRNYATDSVTFCQRKFQLCQDAAKQGEDGSYRWWVPISYSSKTENINFQQTKPSLWLSNNDHCLTTGNITVNESSWLIVNVQETGYYRVNYDDNNWQLIINQLINNHLAIHKVNRAQLLDDAFHLARAGQLDYEFVLKMTLYLKDDNEYLPWEAFFNSVEFIEEMLSKTPIYGLFQKFVQALLHKQYMLVGINDNRSESFLIRQHQTGLIRMACHMDYSNCVDTALELFSSWMKTDDPDQANPIPANHRHAVYCTAIKFGGETEWDFLWERYLNTDLANERIVLLLTLGCSKDEWTLKRYLLWASAEGSGIRKQDGSLVFKLVSIKKTGGRLVFNLIRENWLHMAKYFGLAQFGLSDVFKYAVTGMNTAFELAELEEFQIKYRSQLGSAYKNVEQAIESVRGNVKWMENNYNIFKTWLENNFKHDSPSIN